MGQVLHSGGGPGDVGGRLWRAGGQQQPLELRAHDVLSWPLRLAFRAQYELIKSWETPNGCIYSESKHS